MLATVTAATLDGVRGRVVTVEVHRSKGLPSFTIVGLPDAACREARDRVRAAVLSCGLTWPDGRVTVNLAPSDLRKGGAALDLAIAVAVLAVTEQVPQPALEAKAFLGELGLDGTVRPVVGVLPLVDALADREVVTAADSWHLAAAAEPVRVHCALSLGQVASALLGRSPWPDPPPKPPAAAPPLVADFGDVLGQAQARRAAEASAAGGHHLLMLGPPGAGKTMLARRLVSLLPDLDAKSAFESARVQSAAGLPLPAGLSTRPVLRSPHHTATMAALVGGGSGVIRPGEISLAHRGVLFLDELGEFAPAVLDALRQPLEEGIVRISRAHGSCDLPARFLLVAAMNPCPCGNAGKPTQCSCSEQARLRYARRLSGPLLDRFDLRVPVQRPTADALLSDRRSESTACVAARVQQARLRAAARGVEANADLSGPQLAACSTLTPEATGLLRREISQGRLSGRGMHRVRSVALTLCDLAQDDPVIDECRLSDALSLRSDVSALTQSRRAA